MTSTRKCLSYSGLCRPISAILRMLNGCTVLVARKLLQSVTNGYSTLKYRQVCTEYSNSCSRHRSQIFTPLCCEIITRLPNVMGQLTDIKALRNCSFFKMLTFIFDH